jgi:hypothetical protein
MTKGTVFSVPFAVGEKSRKEMLLQVRTLRRLNNKAFALIFSMLLCIIVKVI